MARSTTTRKSTTARSSSSAEPSGAEAEATPLTDAAEEGPTGPQALRKKELIDRVVALSGMKKKDVKPVVEATLAVLGTALSNEEPLNLQPLGKVVINRKKELANGEVLITRIRRSTQAQAESAETAQQPLAEQAE